MPNPWDVGSARLLASLGFEALATTSAGFAWSLGRLDQNVTRDELVAHVAELTAADGSAAERGQRELLSRRSGWCRRDSRATRGRRGGRLLAGGLRPGCASDRGTSSWRSSGSASRPPQLTRSPSRWCFTARAENHLRGVQDLDDTIRRLVAYRDAGADAVYAPGLTDLEQIARLVREVEIPVNVLVLPGGPTVSELEAVGVRRISTGSLLASAAYGALVEEAQRLLTDGAAPAASDLVSREALDAAFAVDA